MAEAAATARSTETVIVACKLPHGLRMRLFDFRKINEPILGGGSREVDQSIEKSGSYTLNGNAHPQNAGPRCVITNGFALTPDIPKEFWEAWKKQNQDSEFIRSGLIFAYSKADSIEGEAKEKKNLRAGLERLDPNKMPTFGRHKLEKSDLMKTADQLIA